MAVLADAADHVIAGNRILADWLSESNDRITIVPSVVEGKTILVFAITEPDAGSNTFRIQTVAKRDGDRYVMNGQKIFITGVEDLTGNTGTGSAGFTTALAPGTVEEVPRRVLKEQLGVGGGRRHLGVKAGTRQVVDARVELA